MLFTLESCWPKSSSFWDNGVFSVSASEMCFWILPKIQTQVNEARQDSLPFQFVSPLFFFMFYLHLTVDEWAPPASVSWRDKDQAEETLLFSAGRLCHHLLIIPPPLHGPHPTCVLFTKRGVLLLYYTSRGIGCRCFDREANTSDGYDPGTSSQTYITY